MFSAESGSRMWTHARITWYDGDVSDFPPRIRILRRAAGSSLIRVDSRITVMGPRYRVDFLDGSPARLYGLYAINLGRCGRIRAGC